MIRTLFDRILMLAVCSLALPCVLLAQNEPLPEDVTLGAFETQGSVTFGYRFSDISGRKQKFAELFNLQQGPRLLDFNLMGKVQEGEPQFADRFSISASGLGGDPFAGGQLTLKKDKLYDLRINYRQSYYYWDRNDDVLLPAGAGQPQWRGLTSNHDWATVRRFGDANLAVHVTNNLRLLFEYGRNSRRGVNYSTRTMDYFGNEEPWGSFERANPYYIEAPIDDHSQRFAGGFSYSLKSWNFHYKLGYQDFRSIMDWQNVGSAERSINSSIVATGNELLDFARYFESRELKTPVSEFSFLGRPHHRVDVRGGYIYYRYKGPSSMQAVYDGTARTDSGGTAFAPYSVENKSRADLTEPNHVVDGGVSVKIKDWWNWHADYRYSRFTVDSAVNFDSLRDNAIQNTGEAAYQWQSRTHLIDTNMEFVPTRGLILRPGIRVMSRDVKVLEDGVIDDVRTKKINTVWPVLGAFYQPTKKFSVRGDFQSITNGASYTRISPHTDVGGRIVFRFKPTEKITVEDNLVLRSRKFLDTQFRNNLHLNAINIAYDLNERFGVYGGFSYDSWFATASVTFIRGTQPRDVTWQDQTVNRVWTGGLAIKPMRRLGFNFSGNFVRTTGAGTITGEPPYFGPLTWPLATGTLYYDVPRLGRLSVDLQRSYYLEEIVRANDFGSHLLTIRWTRDF